MSVEGSVAAQGTLMGQILEGHMRWTCHQDKSLASPVSVKPLKRQQNSALQLFLLDWEQGKVRSRAVSNGIILDGKDRQNFQHSAFLFSLYRK
jgi:hypothetical protein